MRAGKKEKLSIILLAEDDAADQELTRRALEEGKIASELHIVENGEEALNYLFHRGKYKSQAQAPTPDLLLLDLNLPRVDGHQVLKQIRADARLRSMAVVVLTTSRLEEDVKRCYELGCNSFITKPAAMDQFLRAIQVMGEYWFKVVNLPTKME